MAWTRDALIERFNFSARGDFTTSPLYRTLSAYTASDSALLDLAEHCRVGQQPANLLLASVHYLLLAGTDHELKNFYPSIVGDAALSPDGAGPAFQAFSLEHHDEIAGLLATRLVQTTVVKRAAALRLGLMVIAQREAEPITLLDIGTGTGSHLLFDRYRYCVGDQEFGDRSSSVRIDVEWRGEASVPDLGGIPVIAHRLGVDLNPVDLSDPDQRHWLRALVWPENDHEAELLEATLATVAAHQPEIIRGDILDIAKSIASDNLSDAPLVVFHAATRAHIPPERREEFDNAIRNFSDGRTLYWLSLEGGVLPEPRKAGAAFILTLRTVSQGNEQTEYLALVEGHGDWIEPLNM
jgi:hypothetical protein